MKVYCTSVTEQWATVAINGPMARALLAELTSDIPLDDQSFPFMSLREGTVAGIPARVFRISFTGDLSYEVNVPASYGHALWQALITAGEKYSITPYGTETMHVLRAEKGFVIVGQETDGTITPQDLGMDWIVSKQKPDFIGKRSLRRPDTARGDRKHLVGLLTENPSEVIPEGGQIVAELKDKPPMDHDRPCDLELFQPQRRALDRHGAGEERPRPHRRHGLHPAGGPHASGPR